MTTKDDIEQLNSFLRGELSAVATYEQCIKKMDSPAIVQQLRSLQMSHQSRVRLLSERIVQLGGVPSEEAGLWGGIAKMIEGGAAVFGQGFAVSALEEGEDHGLADYRSDLDKLSVQERVFVEQQILPEQQRTHDVLSRLESTI